MVRGFIAENLELASRVLRFLGSVQKIPSALQSCQAVKHVSVYRPPIAWLLQSQTHTLT